MMFCHIFSFGVVSAPMSYSLDLFPFPWIELLNEILTSIFSDFISASLLAAVPQDVTRRAFLTWKATYCRRGKKKKFPFYFGRWCFTLFIESVLIMGGTLGRYGASSVKNIYDFLFPR